MQAGSELNRAALFDHSMQAVVIDQQFAVDVEARTIVGGDEERVLAWLFNHDMTGEHQSESIASFQHRLIHHDRVATPVLPVSWPAVFHEPRCWGLEHRSRLATRLVNGARAFRACQSWHQLRQSIEQRTLRFRR
jgi:hypothetical protein